MSSCSLVLGFELILIPFSHFDVGEIDPNPFLKIISSDVSKRTTHHTSSRARTSTQPTENTRVIASTAQHTHTITSTYTHTITRTCTAHTQAHSHAHAQITRTCTSAITRAQRRYLLRSLVNFLLLFLLNFLFFVFLSQIMLWYIVTKILSFSKVSFLVNIYFI